METPKIIRAAEYMRMSTEHQQYSIANQSVAIQEYAAARSIEIVRTYVDRAKSGLRLSGRYGLQELLRTVESGDADFTMLLVYDVSRWGRFQDVDESAFYEFTLRRAGVNVIYCAEMFQTSGGPLDSLLKTLKRTMAAEYSRELSVKVSQGQRRIAQLGYRLGGSGGFGLQRVSIDPAGSRRTLLKDGERKSIKTDRVTLVRGPEQEVRIVQKVFQLFVEEGLGEKKIAEFLNEHGISTRRGNGWSRETVHRMLTNPKYAGDLTYCRTRTSMGSAPVLNERDNWIYLPDTFPPIVSRGLWQGAQEVLQRRAEHTDKERMLALLRLLLARSGRLSYDLIDAEPEMPSAQTYHKQFGTIREAYRRIGWTPSAKGTQTTRRPEVRALRLSLETAVNSRIAQTTEPFSKDPRLPLWTISENLSIYVALVVATNQERRRVAWVFSRRVKSKPKTPIDVLVMARLNIQASAILDYYVFPGCRPNTITIFEQNPLSVDIHRFEDLTFLDMLCCRTKLSEIEGVSE
jgi:DNA invertase Pin-like site-specific DNA recombinase